jgi:hypothetical protein
MVAPIRRANNMDTNATQWWYGSQGQQMGPVSEGEMRSMVAAGQLGPDTMVWREGMTGWQPLPACLELSTANPWMTGYVGVAPTGTTSGLAIASLVCGIVSLMAVFCYISGVAAIPAVICGHLALRRIRNAQVPIGGRGLAIAGLITGYLGLLGQLAMIGVIVAIIVSANAQSGGFHP